MSFGQKAPDSLKENSNENMSLMNIMANNISTKKARKSFYLNVKSWSTARWRQIILSDGVNIEKAT
ncbi:hypothetical protein BpHYR1_011380 [Brachionus plicatilis]|uniref:Uncharacterized protein n=1 Tax=Brachionus plicatilis TaxID=10195 RepID=A0A3M7T4J8_BRAPC|nr:hypothetical protein BpHYR1_011380 [Brachionus plicatilis]